jgi:hypothetical protein
LLIDVGLHSLHLEILHLDLLVSPVELQLKVVGLPDFDFALKDQLLDPLSLVDDL